MTDWMSARKKSPVASYYALRLARWFDEHKLDDKDAANVMRELLALWDLAD